MSDLPVQPNKASDQNLERGISLLDLVVMLVKHRKLLLLITGCTSLLAVAFLFATSRLPDDSPWNLLPDRYAPNVRVFLQEGSTSSSMSQALKSSGLSSIASLAGISGISKRTSVDLARDLLKDRALLDTVAAEFDFTKRYGLSKNPRTGARALIGENLQVRYNDLSGILTIAYSDIDKEFATRVVARIVDLLAAEFRRLTQDAVVLKRTYLEESVAVQTVKSDQAAHDYVVFQQKYGVLDVATQVSEMSKSMAAVQSQLTAKQLELRVAEQYYPAADARIVKLKAEIQQLEQLQKEVREGSQDYSTGGVAQKDLPELSLQYLALKREVEIQQSILSIFKQQLELARLEELDTSAMFQIVDPAEVPERRAEPRRALIAIIAVVAGACLGILAAIVASYLERSANDPVEAGKIAAIRGLVGRRRAPRSRRRA
jgi:tyrosine-protein kinase Etk/Wzc